MERSNRDMFRQFEEQSRRDEKSVKENRALRQKNHDLEKQIITLEKSFDDRIALVVQQAVDQATLLLSRGASTETGTNSCEGILMPFLGGVGQSAKLTIISQT